MYVGRGRTARDIRPIVVLHHDEENRLEWLVPGGRHGEAGGVAGHAARGVADDDRELVAVVGSGGGGCGVAGGGGCADRSEEHTSELQSLTNLVCRLLLDKKNQIDPRMEHAGTSGTPLDCDSMLGCG